MAVVDKTGYGVDERANLRRKIPDSFEVPMTTWCDKLASTPTVGFRLDYQISSGDSILDALSPILGREAKDDKPRLQMETHQSFELSLTTETGFKYGIDASKVSVAFAHRLRPKNVSGGAPVMEMLSRPLPYTELLQEVSKRAIEATLVVPGNKTRTFHRVGIISTTFVADEEVPPGIKRFVEYINRPWQGIDNFSIQITGDIGSGSGYTDRCIHTVVRPEDKDRLMSLNFDFQRTFTSGKAINEKTLEDQYNATEKAALKYFEDLAEGSLFDENLIVSKSA